jgi:hypothetical protein
MAAKTGNKLKEKSHDLTLELTLLYFFRKKIDMKFIILVSNLKEISPSVFS